MRRVLASALAGVLWALVACAPTVDGDGALAPTSTPRIDVDTPTLRAMKKKAGVAPCPAVTPAPVEGGLPDLTLPCFGGGREVNLSGLRGPLVINLWANWCGPCRKEMPVIQAFHERYGDRVAVIGIDYTDVQTELAMRLVQDTGVTYPLLADTQGELDRREPFPGLATLPFWAFVDEKGVVRAQVFRQVDSEPELVGLVEQHLGVTL